MINRERQEMTTVDGRTLCWAEFGLEAGRPVMFFHGGNDSRLAGGLLKAAAIATGVRLICPERPGFGRSTFQPGRGLLDWSSDVEQLADVWISDDSDLWATPAAGPMPSRVQLPYPNGSHESRPCPRSLLHQRRTGGCIPCSASSTRS